MCIDFRMLSKQKNPDIYLIPWIDEILYHLCKAWVFLKIDLGKAYQKLAIEPSHIHKTTFLTKYRLLEFLVQPFRLVNTPEILTAGKYLFLGGTPIFPAGLLWYDLLVYSETIDLHV